MLDEGTKVLIEATRSFAEQLTISNRLMQEISSDVKRIIDFQYGAEGIQKKIGEVKKEVIEHGDARQTDCNLNVKNSVDKLISELNNTVKVEMRAMFNKVLVLFLSATALISGVVWLVEKFTVQRTVTEVAKELLKQMGK